MIRRFKAARSVKAHIRAVRRCAMKRGWVIAKAVQRSERRRNSYRMLVMREIRAQGLIPRGLKRKAYTWYMTADRRAA